jgi:hypothetical protein
MMSLKPHGVVVEVGDRSLNKWYEIAPLIFAIVSCASLPFNLLAIGLVGSAT